MKRTLIAFLPALAAACLLLVSCSKGNTGEDPKPTPTPEEEDIQTPHKKSFDGTYYHDIPNAGWETEVKARADMMLMQWTPLADVPGSFIQKGKYFKAGETVTGIPYSSVQSYCCFMGRDVSFYTFLSSLRNPKSLMYTTDYRTPTDYRHRSCYYGSTCCNTVIYNWGIQMRATCYAVGTLSTPLIYRRKTTSLAKVQLFDMVLYGTFDAEDDDVSGHAMMVYDIARDKDGNIKELTIFESAHPTSRLTKYTLAEYKARLDEQEKKGNGKAYFYFFDHESNDGMYALPPFMENNPTQMASDFPTALCLDRGDRVTYEMGTDVVVNILSSDYSQIELYKDGTLYKTRNLDGTSDVTFKDLPVGMYEACLASGGNTSDRTRFEVASKDFTVTLEKGSIVLSNLGGTPAWISVNSGIDPNFLPVRQTSPGIWTYSGNKLGDATHVRVHFIGRYSRYTGDSKKIKI